MCVSAFLLLVLDIHFSIAYKGIQILCGFEKLSFFFFPSLSGLKLSSDLRVVRTGFFFLVFFS